MLEFAIYEMIAIELYATNINGAYPYLSTDE
jgi:hypothetical protein